MSSLSSFIARNGKMLARKAAVPEAPEAEANGLAHSGGEEWAKIGLRIGGENEAFRNLLIETGRKIGALDELKQTFARLTGPLEQTLSALERETSENFSLRATLNELRTSHETLRAEFKDLGKKFAEKETENGRLRHELNLAQQTIEASQARATELASELEEARARLSELESQLARDAGAVQMLMEQKQSLTEHTAAADKHIAELEAVIASTREKLDLRDDENRSLQGSVDHVVSENSRLSRRLADSDAALHKARLQIEQTKSALNATESERTKLTAALDEANEKYQVETNTLSARLEATSSRTSAAEKMLAEVRQNLLVRAEEVSAVQRKLVEATIARNATDKKLELLQNKLQMKDRQLQEAEQSRLKLVERCDTMTKADKIKSAVLARAEERLQQLTEQVARLEGEAESSRAKTEKSAAEFKSQLEHERLERTLTEGALRKARSNYLQLQRRMDEHTKLNGADRGKGRQQSSPKDLRAVPSQSRSMSNGAVHADGDEASHDEANATDAAAG